MKIAEGAGDLARAEAFLEGLRGAPFMQSPQWARVKGEWKNETVLAEDPDGRVTGVMSLLIRRVPLFGNIIYCPRGPVCERLDRDTLAQLTAGAWEIIGKYRAAGLHAEPDIPEEDTAALFLFDALGWRRRPCRDVHDTVQPRSLFRLELRGKTEEELLAGFHKKLRYNIRLAQRRGVVIEEGGRGDLAGFSRLMAVTARRDGFLPRPAEYFTRIWDALGPERVSLLQAKVDGEIAAAGLFVHYGGRTWYLYGVSADRHREDMPCPLLHWEAIRRALARGDDIYDLRGFLEREDDSCGLYRFKRQFGGDLVHLAGELCLTASPLRYNLLRAAERSYLKLAPKLSKRR